MFVSYIQPNKYKYMSSDEPQVEIDLSYDSLQSIINSKTNEISHLHEQCAADVTAVTQKYDALINELVKQRHHEICNLDESYCTKIESIHQDPAYVNACFKIQEYGKRCKFKTKCGNVHCVQHHTDLERAEFVNDDTNIVDQRTMVNIGVEKWITNVRDILSNSCGVHSVLCRLVAEYCIDFGCFNDINTDSIIDYTDFANVTNDSGKFKCHYCKWSINYIFKFCVIKCDQLYFTFHTQCMEDAKKLFPSLCSIYSMFNRVFKQRTKTFTELLTTEKISSGFILAASDHLGTFYKSEIIKLDNDKQRVHVHFIEWKSRYDEWISYSEKRFALLADIVER